MATLRTVSITLLLLPFLAVSAPLHETPGWTISNADFAHVANGKISFTITEGSDTTNTDSLAGFSGTRCSAEWTPPDLPTSWQRCKDGGNTRWHFVGVNSTYDFEIAQISVNNGTTTTSQPSITITHGSVPWTNETTKTKTLSLKTTTKLLTPEPLQLLSIGTLSTASANFADYNNSDTGRKCLTALDFKVLDPNAPAPPPPTTKYPEIDEVWNSRPKHAPAKDSRTDCSRTWDTCDVLSISSLPKEECDTSSYEFDVDLEMPRETDMEMIATLDSNGTETWKGNVVNDFILTVRHSFPLFTAKGLSGIDVLSALDAATLGASGMDLVIISRLSIRNGKEVRLLDEGGAANGSGGEVGALDLSCKSKQGCRYLAAGGLSLPIIGLEVD